MHLGAHRKYTYTDTEIVFVDDYGIERHIDKMVGPLYLSRLLKQITK